ncbi:ATP-binding protein [Clostridium botulinum]|uniref:ATP-binding protein n=1 Tax=Clostridium botulinum TaxID=1491 RepID=UPI000A6E7BCB|nr:ATP-binding protein [Clostridium botulinum]
MCTYRTSNISHRSSYLPTDDLTGLFGINTFTQMLLYSKTMRYLEIILGEMFICYDFQYRIVQNAVSSGIIKFKILLSKVIVYYIAEKSQSRYTGLGLFIVKLLTEQMNGEVNAFFYENNLDIQIELNRYIN